MSKCNYCDEPVFAKNMCRLHYQRHYFGRPMDAPLRGGIKICQVPGCKNKHQAKGMCATHWGRAWRKENKPANAPKYTRHSEKTKAQVIKLHERGWTNKEISKHLEINYSTVVVWIKNAA